LLPSHASNRFRSLLKELKDRSLTQYVNVVNSTEEGKAFVIEYEGMLKLLAQFTLNWFHSHIVMLAIAGLRLSFLVSITRSTDFPR